MKAQECLKCKIQSFLKLYLFKNNAYILDIFELLILYTGWGTGTVPPTVVEGGQFYGSPPCSGKSIEEKVDLIHQDYTNGT